MKPIREALPVAVVAFAALACGNAFGEEASPFYAQGGWDAVAAGPADGSQSMGSFADPITPGAAGTVPGGTTGMQPIYYVPVIPVFLGQNGFGTFGSSGQWIRVQPMVPMAPVPIIALPPAAWPSGGTVWPVNDNAVPSLPWQQLSPAPMTPTVPAADPWDDDLFAPGWDDGWEEPAGAPQPAVPSTPATSPIPAGNPQPAAKQVMESPFYQ